MMPAAVSHVETNMALICANRMDVDVLRMLRYCRMSGRVMRRRARRKRRPAAQNAECVILGCVKWEIEVATHALCLPTALSIVLNQPQHEHESRGRRAFIARD